MPTPSHRLRSPRRRRTFFIRCSSKPTSRSFCKASGRLAIDDKPIEVTGQAWMDREWSSQPLAPDQTGWDWFALHVASGEKLMLYRMRQKDGRSYASGTWIL